MRTFRKIWVTGRYHPDEPLIDIWRRGAPVGNPPCLLEINEAESVEDGDLLLVLADHGLADKARNSLLDRRATTVLRLAGESANPADEAVHLCVENPNVVDVVGLTATHTSRFKKRLSDLYKGERLYPEILALKTVLANGAAKVFPGTPFDEDIARPFLSAVGAALRPPGFTINNPGARHGLDTVSKEVREAISDSALIVLNAREGSNASRYNPNVWFEYGFAEGLIRLGMTKEILVFRYVRDQQEDLPADVRGKIWGVYEDDLDLAMQLYWGQ